MKKGFRIPESKFRFKVLLCMKLIFLLTFACCMQVSAKVFSQDIKINLNLENVKLTKALRVISQKSDYHFLYNNDLLPQDLAVNITVKQETVPEIMKTILRNSGLTFRVLNNKLIAIGYLSELPDTLQKLTGTISDSTGQPLIGVSIQVKGTTMGTVTDANGKFSLNVPDNAVLIVSYIGYKPEQIPVNGQTQLNIVLRNSATGLGEVVVTALGIKRQERELGYATQEIKGSTLETVKGVNVGTSLTGKVAGLMVENSPNFMSAPVITLRGATPLLVVDGVPYGNVNLSDIPADNIESITFLKGAAASALYGSRGGNGAIMVTTKKGGKKGLSVSVNSSSMFAAGFLAIPKMQDEYGRVVNTATNTYDRSADGSWGPPMQGQTVIQWDPISKTMKPMPYLPVGKNNFKNFVRPGYILNNNVSVTETGEMGSLRASANWIGNTGVYPNEHLQKVNYSLGGTIKVKKFTLSTSLSYDNQASPNFGFTGYTAYNPMYSMLVWGSPDWNILDYKDYWVIPNQVQNSSYTAGINNPYFNMFERTHSYQNGIFNGEVTANYEINSWLKAMVRTGYDNFVNQQTIDIPVGSFQGGGATTVLDGGTQVWGESQRGSYNIGINRGLSTNSDAILFVNKDIKDFSINGFAGGSIYYQQSEGIEAMTQGGLSIPGFYSLLASVNPVFVNSITSKQQTNSVYGKLGVGWKSLAFLEGTFRNDWASTLPKSTRSFFYPSLAASFIPSELFQTNGWLTYWKLRGSWTTYKTPAGIYDINNVYSITPNAWGTASSATFPTSIRPSNVQAEGSTSTEVGTDLSFLNDRISLNATVYEKRMFDFIVSAPISPSTGFNSVFTNSKEVQTQRGIGVTLNATPVKSGKFLWNVAFNYTKYATYYTKLDPNYTIDYGDSWVKVGARTDYFLLNQFQTDNKGDIVFNNGLPTFKPILSVAGYKDPDWLWGFNTDLHYKNWSFTLSADGRMGGVAQSTTNMYMWVSGNAIGSTTEARYLDATKPGTKNYLGKGVKVVSGAITYNANNQVVSDTRVFAPNDVYATYQSYIHALHKGGDAWGGRPSPVDLFNATFFKIREVAITYQIPAELAHKIRSKGISISAIGQNLFYWAKQFKSSDIDGGSENFADPSLRYVGVDVKLNF